MRWVVLAFALAVVGCDLSSFSNPYSGQPDLTLAEAREGFKTNIVSSGDSFGPADRPTTGEFELIKYNSPVGPLAAYVSADPGNGEKNPAIIWITGGDNNSIGDVWSSADRSNDQSVSVLRRETNIVTMFPSQRGGNDNPGQREGFFGEVDDILAAADYLAGLPYVDPDQIYLGGHSTGGTLAMVIGAYSDRFKAIFALGPVATADQYGGDFIYCDTFDRNEIALRSPAYWLHCVKSPMFVFEGAEQGNWDAIEPMANKNENPNIKFFEVPGHDHFSVIAPVTDALVDPIITGKLDITQESLEQ